MAPNSRRRYRKYRSGFVLVTTAVTIIVLLGLLGLAIDVGHIFVARSELQIFADEAAFAATFELDGTSQGITRAQNVALTGSVPGAPINRWNFGTQTAPAATVKFSTTPGGTYSASPSNAAGYRFIQIQVTASVPVYFLPLIPGIPTTKNITVTSIAGQDQQTSLGDGVAPFSPDAHNPADANFGYTPGGLYTLRWPPNGQLKKQGCPGDSGFSPGGGSSDRGYIDIGQGNGNSALRDAVVDNNFHLAQPLQIGSPIDTVPGQKNVSSAIDERFGEDTDTSHATFSTYTGNGRRLLTVPVNDGSDAGLIVGFALFFLQPNACGDKNNSPCCAEYVGPAVKGSSRRGGGTAGLYGVQLVQ
ncbi:MAG TPA: pilus assembly protein TadG-related protein [Bryobacteraceae bacterium]